MFEYQLNPRQVSKSLEKTLLEIEYKLTLEPLTKPSKFEANFVFKDIDVFDEQSRHSYAIFVMHGKYRVIMRIYIFVTGLK